MTFKELEQIKKEAKASLEEWKGVAARIVSSKGYWSFVNHHATAEDRAYVAGIIECLDRCWMSTSTSIVNLIDSKIEESQEHLENVRGFAASVGQTAMEHLRELDTFVRKYRTYALDEEYRCPHIKLCEDAARALNEAESEEDQKGH